MALAKGLSIYVMNIFVSRPIPMLDMLGTKETRNQLLGIVDILEVI